MPDAKADFMAMGGSGQAVAALANERIILAALCMAMHSASCGSRNSDKTTRHAIRDSAPTSKLQFSTGHAVARIPETELHASIEG